MPVSMLRSVPFLAVLPEADFEALAGTAKRRRFKRGETVFHKDDPGNSFFVIESGSFRIYMPGPEGSDLILAILGPGDYVGELSLLDGQPRSASAAADEKSEALVLLRADFFKIVSARPEAALAVMVSVVERLRQADEAMADLAFLDVKGRLAKKLLELAAKHGEPTPRGIQVNLFLTQEELAQMVGVTRESVNRHIASFRELGMIDVKGRQFLILQPEELRKRTV